MADQLMEVDLEKVIQIQKDDFICKDHNFRLLPYMREKSNELYETNGATTKLDRKLAYTEDEHTVPCYLSGIEDDQNPVFAEIENQARIHSDRFAHIDNQQIINHPVISLDGPGGTGKTDFLLRNKLLQRKVYIAQSHKLCRAKAHEYNLVFSGDCQLEQIESELRDVSAFKKKQLKHRGEIVLQVTVWARAFHDSELIWDVIHRYANVLIFDEVSMLHNETVTFLMDRFNEHKVYLCGDPGFQLAAYKRNTDDEMHKTPFDAKKLNIPSYTFTKIFRVKCDRLMDIRLEGRKILEKGVTTLSHNEYRTIHEHDTFPSTWGQKLHGQPGPVAGKTFTEVEENNSYCENVASAAETGILSKFRRYIDPQFHYAQLVSVSEIEAFYLSKFTTVNSVAELAKLYTAWEYKDNKYTPKDMIITSTNEFADEWTEYLTPLQPEVNITKKVNQKQGKMFRHFKDSISEKAYINRKTNNSYAALLTAPEEKRAAIQKTHKHYQKLSTSIREEVAHGATTRHKAVLQKWKIKTTTRDFTNGEIVISDVQPTEKSLISHAFTAHSTIGETANGKVFIDRRNMFELEHWETAIGRAKRWEDIVIINLPDPDPSEKYAKTKIYSISSKRGGVCYIGHTTQKLEKRISGHADEVKNKKKSRCTSHLVMKFKDWQADLIEEYPCASKYQAEARENYHVKLNQNCVNRTAPLRDKMPGCAPKRVKNV